MVQKEYLLRFVTEDEMVPIPVSRARLFSKA
jgi:hypothetical protein